MRGSSVVLVVLWLLALPAIVLSAVWFGLSDAVGSEEGAAEGSGWAAVPYLALAALVAVTIVVARHRRT